jgi:hypothetical protein
MWSGNAILIGVEKTYSVSCSDVTRRASNNNKLHSENLQQDIMQKRKESSDVVISLKEH